MTNGFEKLGLSEKILKAIKDLGYENPSPIQEQAIPMVMQGHDIIGQAKTGTGKTMAFGIPAVEAVDPADNSLQVMVLCPTRELAVQVAGELKKVSKHKKGIKTLAIYGGQSISIQLKAIERGVQIIAGTPGRVIDHIERGTIKLDSLKLVILDEADEMLNMGFRDDIEKILAGASSERQTVFFSATMPKEIMNLSKRFQKKDRQVVKVEGRNLTADAIEQSYIKVRSSDKTQMLSRLLDIHSPRLSLIFMNTKKGVDDLALEFSSMGYHVDALHGDMSQQKRDSVMNKFRNGIIRVLIATDVAARGLDVDNVDAVFNYQIPQDIEYYVHRIGRTGRAGKKGMSFSFAWGEEVSRLRRIESYTKAPIKMIAPPSVEDVEKIRIQKTLEDILAKASGSVKKSYVKAAHSLIEGSAMEPEALLAAVISMMCNPVESKEEQPVFESTFDNTGAREAGMVRLFVNAGRKQKLRPKDIIGAIAGESGIKGENVGRIDIYEKFTFVEVTKDSCRQVLSAMNGAEIRGHAVAIEPANCRN